MASKILSNANQDVEVRREDYLKSMFFCVTPESLTPLAALMYQEFKKTCPENLHMVFQYEDEKKVF